jgi:hypothetical protein
MTGDDKLTYLLLGASISFVSSFFISFFIFYLNKKKERRHLVSELKSKVIGAADNLLKCLIIIEYTLMKYNSSVQRTKLAEKNNDKEYIKEHISVIFKFEDRYTNASFEFGFVKSKLLESLTELYDYIPSVDVKNLNEKYQSLQGLKEQVYDFSKCNTINEVNELESTILKGIRDSIMNSTGGKILTDIKKYLSPHI